MLFNFFKNLHYILIVGAVFVFIDILCILITFCFEWSRVFQFIFTLFSSLLSVYVGYIFSEYKNKKSAVNELCSFILETWDEAKINDENSKSDFYNEMRSIGKNSWAFDKEVGIVYMLSIKFENIKWYEHTFYDLPSEYKKFILKYQKYMEEVDFSIYAHKNTTLFELSKNFARFTPPNTYGILKPFLEFIIHDKWDGKFKKELNDIISTQESYYKKNNINKNKLFDVNYE